MAKPMTTAEAADRLDLTPGYLSNLRCWGRGPRWHRIGRAVRYDAADIDAWRERRKADQKET